MTKKTNKKKVISDVMLDSKPPWDYTECKIGENCAGNVNEGFHDLKYDLQFNLNLQAEFEYFEILSGENNRNYIEKCQRICTADRFCKAAVVWHTISADRYRQIPMDKIKNLHNSLNLEYGYENYRDEHFCDIFYVSLSQNYEQLKYSRVEDSGALYMEKVYIPSQPQYIWFKKQKFNKITMKSQSIVTSISIGICKNSYIGPNKILPCQCECGSSTEYIPLNGNHILHSNIHRNIFDDRIHDPQSSIWCENGYHTLAHPCQQISRTCICAQHNTFIMPPLPNPVTDISISPDCAQNGYISTGIFYFLLLFLILT